MCKICSDSVKEFFPDVPDDEYGDFLMSCTAFPFADGETTRQQLRELRQKTSNYRACYGIAEQELNEALKKYNESMKVKP